MTLSEFKRFSQDYRDGFYAGENLYEFRDDESDEWKRGYRDGVYQTDNDCPVI